MILSGRYQLHYDTTGGGGTGHTNGLPLNFTLLPEAMRSAGYTTSFLGKWHLGESQVEQTPHRRGFDWSLGYFGGQEDYYTHNVAASWPDGNTSTARLPGNMTKTCNMNGACKCEIVDLWQSDPTSQGPAALSLTGEYSMFFYARRAVEIIEAQAAVATAGTNDTRMFMYFASQLVHDPHQVPQRFIDLYPPTAAPGGCPASADNDTEAVAGGYCDCCGRRVVLAMMSCLDEVVLNVTNALERTGLMANTLFVFTSDNGGVVADHGANVPLRGGKFSDWEGGVRSPAFISGPLVPPQARGKWYNGIISATDWSVTFLNLAGVKDVNASMGAKIGTVPALDGVDMWSAVCAVGGSTQQQAAATVRTETWIETGKLRMGEYKLINSNCGGRGLTGTGGGWIKPATNATKAYPNQGALNTDEAVDWFLLHGCNKTDPCLYHVGGDAWDWTAPYANDAIESVNLATDPSHASRLAAMTARLTQIEKTAWSGEVAATDNGKCCDQAIKNDGVLGPWIDPTE